MTFDPNAHMRKLQGKDYLEVKWRLVWFRQDHPDWGIQTRLVEHDPEAGRAVLMAAIYADPQVHGDTPVCLAVGHKQETRKDFPDYLEKAETGAIGRALAALGYGTQFAPELDDGDRPADSPMAAKPPPPARKPDPDRRIDSRDDELYQKYAGLTERAAELGVPFEVAPCPIAEGALRALATKLQAAIKAKKGAA